MAMLLHRGGDAPCRRVSCCDGRKLHFHAELGLFFGEARHRHRRTRRFVIYRCDKMNRADAHRVSSSSCRLLVPTPSIRSQSAAGA